MLAEVLLRELSSALGYERITAVTPIRTDVILADSTDKYSIHTKRGAFILIISNAVSPLLVQRGATRQREAKSRLHGPAAEVIEVPVHEGFFEEKSYAVWKKGRPLSSNRILSKIQRLLLAPRVYDWLRQVASHKIKSADPSTFVVALRRLERVPSLSHSIKLGIEEACALFHSGEAQAISVVQHGDLWPGNLIKTSSQIGFIVIDWAGAKMDGAPFFDLVRFGMSTGAAKSKLHREIVSHSQILGCHPRSAPAYVLSGLGDLYARLENFPERRFVELCEQKFETVQAAISL